MKKFEIVTSTSFGHKIIVEANTEKEAEDTWEVDGFPMLCTVEEIK